MLLLSTICWIRAPQDPQLKPMCPNFFWMWNWCETLKPLLWVLLWISISKYQQWEPNNFASKHPVILADSWGTQCDPSCYLFQTISNKIFGKTAIGKIKGALSGLRQFLTTESPLKLLFISPQKLFLFSRYLVLPFWLYNEIAWLER